MEDLAAEEATLEAEAACQREIEASNRQRATEATSRQTGIEQAAELAAEEARVLALRTAIQGRRGGTIPPSVTPSPFGNANLIQDGTLTTLPFQPSRTQAMNPLFSDLAEPLFKAISENTLAFVNVLNLSTDYTPDREKLKVLKINSMLAVDTLEEGALHSYQKLKDPCTLSDASSTFYTSRHPLRLYHWAARLLSFTLLYTWEICQVFPLYFSQSSYV